MRHGYLHDESQLTEDGAGYTFYCIGKPEGQPRLAGVDLAVRTSLLKHLASLPIGINERLMTMRIRLANGRHMTVMSVYAPAVTHSDDAREEFYEILSRTVSSIPPGDKIVIFGDFNTLVGRRGIAWEGILDQQRVGAENSNGTLLLSFCAAYGLVITNTLFQQKTSPKTTWMHSRFNHWHLLDYAIVWQRDRRDVHLTRAIRHTTTSDSYPVAFRRRKRGDAEDFGKMRGAQRAVGRRNSVFPTILCAPPKSDWVRVCNHLVRPSACEGETD